MMEINREGGKLSDSQKLEIRSMQILILFMDGCVDKNRKINVSIGVNGQNFFFREGANSCWVMLIPRTQGSTTITTATAAAATKTTTTKHKQQQKRTSTLSTRQATAE